MPPNDSQATQAPGPIILRKDLLSDAIEATCNTRQSLYGPPHVQLDLAERLYQLWSSEAKDKYCPAHNQAMREICTKLSRIACAPREPIKPGDFRTTMPNTVVTVPNRAFHRDNYLDGAAYFSIGYEAQALVEKQLPPITGEKTTS